MQITEKRPIVWVVKEQVRQTPEGPRPMDYSPALRFGDVQFITEFDLPIGPSSTVRANWFDAIDNWAQKYDTERDWIILTGSPLAIFMAGATLGNWGKKARVLVWKREQNEYVPFESALF